MNQLFTPYTFQKEANVFLTAAAQLGWDVTVHIPQEFAFAEIRKGDLRYFSSRGSISVNTNVSTRISSNKFFTNKVLSPHTPFVTEAEKFPLKDVDDVVLQQLLDRWQKVVVKPVDENNGVGVTTSLENIEELKLAVQKIVDLGGSQLLAEKHVPQKNEYRVILWKGEVIDVLQRIPAFVIGDGAKSIEELILEKNQDRQTRFFGIFEPITIDDDLILLLSKRGLILSDILDSEEFLSVETTCNLSQGGEVKRIPLSAVDPGYQSLFSAIFTSTGLNYCGVDLMTPDISAPPRVGETAVNELNGSPGFTVAFFADLAEGTPFLGAKKILEKMETDPVQIT